MGVSLNSPGNRLRVALIAGGLTQGGAEKQMVYMARALLFAGVDVRVFCLTKGDYYQPVLEDSGVPFIYVGEKPNPQSRILTLYGHFRKFRPHIIQSTHFFTNLYVAILGRLINTVSIGSVRSNGFREVKANGRWGPSLMRLPKALILNSEMARQNVLSYGINPERLFVLPNVIDLCEFDRQSANQMDGSGPKTGLTVITAARLVKVKRIELFLSALAEARRQCAVEIKGIIVGDGPERKNLETEAQVLGLQGGAVRFLGMRGDIPALLSQADIFLLTSENEGFPNAILEAMAARLPVIATPAGDAAQIVHHGSTGYIVPHHDVDQISQRLVELAADPELRQRLGKAGRERVEQAYSDEALGGHLLHLYRQIAALQKNRPALTVLSQAV